MNTSMTKRDRTVKTVIRSDLTNQVEHYHKTQPSSSSPSTATLFARPTLLCSSLLRQYVMVGLFASLYIAVGTSITFYNRFVLSTKRFHFEMSMIFTHSIMNFVLSALSLFSCLHKRLYASPEWPTRITFHHIATRFIPIGALLGFDITLTNLAFRLSGVALTEIVKSGVPALVLVEGTFSSQETITKRKFAVVCLLCFGILLTTLGDVSIYIPGLLAALAATFCGASKLVLMQRMLSGKEKTHPILSLFYLAPSAAVSLLIPFALFEAQEVVSSNFFDSEHIFETMMMLGMGGILAFGLNVSELMVIEFSSALSLCVAGVVKLILVIFLSMAFIGYQVTPVNAVGIVLALVGVICYNIIRVQEMSVLRQYAKVSEEDIYDEYLPDVIEMGVGSANSSDSAGL